MLAKPDLRDCKLLWLSLPSLLRCCSSWSCSALVVHHFDIVLAALVLAFVFVFLLLLMLLLMLLFPLSFSSLSFLYVFVDIDGRGATIRYHPVHGNCFISSYFTIVKGRILEFSGPSASI